jgi:hypothetical protein
MLAICCHGYLTPACLVIGQLLPQQLMLASKRLAHASIRQGEHRSNSFRMRTRYVTPARLAVARPTATNSNVYLAGQPCPSLHTTERRSRTRGMSTNGAVDDTLQCQVLLLQHQQR